MAHESKTEKPTERRRQKAREQGQLPRSRELSGAMVVLSALFIVSAGCANWTSTWRAFTRVSLDYAATRDLSNLSPVMPWTAITLAKAITLPCLAAWVVAVAASIVQGGFVFAPQALSLKFERLSPSNKLSQLFSLESVSSLLKALLPTTAIAYLVYGVLEREWPFIVGASATAVPAWFSHLLEIVFELCWKCGLVMLIWSLADYLLVRQRSESQLKMSRQEIREEFKQTEGNPQVKGRIRRLQRSARRRRMLQDVPKATVVVVNPTHFAVALEYRPDMSAPVVLAKGRNLLAQQIKDIARWHDIPVLENPPLAQSLYRTVQVGQQIPAKLFTAVAEILALVFRMQARAAQQRRLK